MLVKLTLVVVGLICRFVLSNGNLANLDQCSLNLQCGDAAQPAATGLNRNPQQGSPGKRGPQGERGEQGPKGQQGESCPCQADLQQRVKKLERRLQIVRSCNDASASEVGVSGGVYTLYPFAGGRSEAKAYCDVLTDGGGWLVFQKRFDGSENFNRTWSEYVNGFGNLSGEFWWGLQKLHQLTNSAKYEMRVDMEDFDAVSAFAHYSTFSVGPPPTYKLTRGSYSGTAGEGMTATGASFSTFDRDQDTWNQNCAQTYKGGGWFAACHKGNPNGVYHGGPHESFADGVNWKPFRGYHKSLKVMEMKIRKKA